MIAAITPQSTDQTSPRGEVLQSARSCTRAPTPGKGWAAADELSSWTPDLRSSPEAPGFLRLINAPSAGALPGLHVGGVAPRRERSRLPTAHADHTGRGRLSHIETERTLDTRCTGDARPRQLRRRSRAGEPAAPPLARAEGGRPPLHRVRSGYDNGHVLGAGGARSHVLRRINEVHAAVMRRLRPSREGLASPGSRGAKRESAPAARARGGSDRIREAPPRRSTAADRLEPIRRGPVGPHRSWGVCGLGVAARGGARAGIVPSDLWKAAHRRIDTSGPYTPAAAGGRTAPDRRSTCSLSPTCAACAALVASPGTTAVRHAGGSTAETTITSGCPVCRQPALYRRRADRSCSTRSRKRAPSGSAPARSAALQRVRRAPALTQDRRATVSRAAPLEARCVPRDEIARGYDRSRLG